MSIERAAPLVPGLVGHTVARQPPRDALPRAMDYEPRLRKILELRARNESLRSIGRQVNLSYERVRVLLARAAREDAKQASGAQA